MYEDGYVADSRVVRCFWAVVHAMPEEQKKALLFFTTGSDRVPIKARRGALSRHYPSS